MEVFDNHRERKKTKKKNSMTVLDGPGASKVNERWRYKLPLTVQGISALLALLFLLFKKG